MIEAMSVSLRVLAAATLLNVAAHAETARADNPIVPKIVAALSDQVGPLVVKATIPGSGPASSSMRAASCGDPVRTALIIEVREQPLTVRRDLSLAMLEALSAQAQQRSQHPTLGFYAGSVGFVPPEIEILVGTPSSRNRRVPCPHLRIRSELVAIDRQVAIASDLLRTPCLLRAATAHYERHADVASRALHRFAAELPMTLGPEIDRYVRSRPYPPEAEDDQLRGFTEGLLVRSVAEFTTRLAVTQEATDTPTEVRSLAPCNDI